VSDNNITEINENKHVTAKDVAELAGVSQSTVSRVLNKQGTNLISEDTIQRVKRIAKQLNYTPNPLARALRGKQTFLIGLIVREIADPFFASLIGTLSSQARALGYQIILGHAQSDPQEALNMTAVLDARHCDGIIVLGDLRDDESAFQEILMKEKAVVGLCRGKSPGSKFTVNCDNLLGVRLLADHLRQLGHKHVAYISGGWLGDIQERMNEFKSLIREYGFITPEGFVRETTNNLQGGYSATCELLELEYQPTAILASDDVMAIGASSAIHKAGLMVPRDISVVGFDDIDLAAYVTPSLTTVRQPIELMSRHALSILLDLIHDKTIPESRKLITVEPELVVRNSTGPTIID